MSQKKSVRALVVDDQEDNRFLFKTVLESLSVSVEIANTGEAAVETLKTRCMEGKLFDIIFLDVMMPGISGIETARQMRGMGYKGPLLAFSAETGSNFKKSAKEVGIDQYLVKSSFSKALAAAVILHHCNVDVDKK